MIPAIDGKRIKAWAAGWLSPMTPASWTLMVTLWTAAIFSLIDLRDAALRDAQRNIDNLTRTIAAESELVFASAEAILLDARQIVEDGDTFSPARIERLLNRRQARVPFLRSIGIHDAVGHLQYVTTQPPPEPNYSVVDREWFSATRETPTRALVISPPMESRLFPGQWVIPVSLRLDWPDKGFRGAVLGTIDLAFFETLFQHLDLGGGSAIYLHRLDGTVLSREPTAENMLGRKMPDSRVFKMLQTQKAGVIRVQSLADGKARIAGGRLLDGYPLYVGISQTEASILRAWRAQLIFILATAVIISLLLLVVMRKSHAAARLQAAGEAVQALVDASPQPLATLHRTAGGDFLVEWANSRFAELFDKPLPKILGQPFGPLLADTSSRPPPQSLDDPKGLRFETILNTAQGPTENQLLFTPVKGRHTVSSTVLVTSLDLTAKRAAARREAERHLFEALGRLAGRIAHEINNVLQPILSHASLALHASKNNTEASAHLGEIQNGVRNGREIVRSVLALAGGKRGTREPRSLEAEMRASLDLIRPSVPSRVTLDVRLHPAESMVCLASGEMFQILSNLIGNAVDSIGTAGIIRIETEAHDVDLVESVALGLAPGAYAQMQVSDSGGGMDADVALHAHEPFFTTKPFGQGTGLGLSTVRSIVDGLDGSLSLSSVRGIGTSVRILFPSAQVL